MEAGTPVYRWHGGRAVKRWGVVRGADGRWIPRLRQEWAAYWRCGRKGHRYERPAARVAILDDPPPENPPWLNEMLFRRCLNGCGCHLSGIPERLPPRRTA